MVFGDSHPYNKSVHCHLEENSWEQLLKGNVFSPLSRRPKYDGALGPQMHLELEEVWKGQLQQEVGKVPDIAVTPTSGTTPYTP